MNQSRIPMPEPRQSDRQPVPTCARCGRILRREPVQVDGRSYGPTCARNLFGAKRIGQSGRLSAQSSAYRHTNVVRDGMTLELFA